MRKITLIAYLIMFCGVIYASDINLNAAAEGMAGANITGTGGMYATGGNSAGLGFGKNVIVAMTYSRELLGMNKTEISGIIPLSAGVIELVGGYGGYGEINNSGAEDRIFNAYDLLVGAGYGIKITDIISAGAGVYINNRYIAGNSSYGVRLDVSAMYSENGLSASVVVKDIIKSAVTAAGIGKVFVINNENEIKGEVTAGLGGEEEMYACIGAEYLWSKTIAARCGYRVEKESINGLSAGAGLKFSTAGIKMNLDYAVSPKVFFENDTEWVHKVSFGILF